MGGPLGYDAFISYSHAKDRPIAAALQSVVQKLGKPWYRRRALRLFRDDTSLSATPHLWPSIELALGQSRFLALLASPEAAASPWVNKEIAYWLDRNSADTVLIALTDGALDWDDAAGDFHWCETAPLPPALKGHFKAEPRWIDLRPYREGASPRDMRFAELGADFAAAIHGVPKEDLLSQEVRQQRRALRLAWSAASVLVALLAIAGWLWTVAETQKSKLRAERDRAEQGLALATDTIYGLSRNFRNVNGLPVGIVDETIPRLRKLLDQLSAGGVASPELRWRESAALVETAETLLVLKDTNDALDAATKARGLMEALTTDYPGNTDYQRSLAISLNKLGDVRKAMGDLAGAVAYYRQGQAVWKTLALTEPGNTLWQDDLASDDDDLGDAMVAQGDLVDALAAYREALALRQALAPKDPGNAGWQGKLSTSDEKIGDVLGAQGNFAGALASYRASLTIRQALASKAPGAPQGQHDLAVSDDEVGDVLKEQGDLPEALDAYQDALAIWQALVAKGPGNALWKNDLSLSFERIGDLEKAQGDVGGAAAAYSSGLGIARALAQQDPNDVDWQIDLALSLTRMARLRDAQANFAEALVILKRLNAAGFLPANDKRWITQIETEQAKAHS